MRLFKNIFYRALLCLTAFLFLARPAFAVTGDHPVLIISSYNPDAGQTSGNISDFMEEFQRFLDGKCGVELENMNCKSFSEAPWKQRMVGILSKYQGTKIPSLIILIGQEAWAAYFCRWKTPSGASRRWWHWPAAMWCFCRSMAQT